MAPDSSVGFDAPPAGRDGFGPFDEAGQPAQGMAVAGSDGPVEEPAWEPGDGARLSLLVHDDPGPAASEWLEQETDGGAAAPPHAGAHDQTARPLDIEDLGVIFDLQWAEPDGVMER